MQFSIDPIIFTHFPGMKIVVAVARGINNEKNMLEISNTLSEVWNTAAVAATEYGNPQSHPQILPWVKHLKNLGVSRKKFPCSIESLIRRAEKGGKPMFINPLVDFYNSVSLRYIVPAGGYDIDQLENGLELRLSHIGDTFQALDSEEPIPVAAGEVSYADNQEILTRHFLWRQSKKGLIVPTTQNVLLLSEILGEFDTELCEKVRSSFAEGIEKYFGVKVTTSILHAENPTIDLY